jgi:hypothetical protein
MKSIICPHCGHKIPGARMVHNLPSAIRQILRVARKPQPIKRLATMYSFATFTSYRSSRRAIERLAKDNYLSRIRPGIYQTKE